jgi:gamma-glutamyl-gamma-aminobutyrate hydrolase PuuD
VGQRKNNKSKGPQPEPEVKELIGTHAVSVIKDTSLEFPELYMEVFFPEEFSGSAFAEMFARAKCTRSMDPNKADLVVFTGGADVDPAYYMEPGQRRHPEVRCNKDRDERDIKMYLHCLSEGIPMLGVCRGAQFIHVMNGGKLYQHVTNHKGNHSMLDVRTHTFIQTVSSTHHQACIPNNRMEILGTTDQRSEKWIDATSLEKTKTRDLEAFFYRDICALGVQGHPEYKGYHQYTQWVLTQIQEMIIGCPDVTPVDRYYRVKKDLVLEREALRT